MNTDNPQISFSLAYPLDGNGTQTEHFPDARSLLERANELRAQGFWVALYVHKQVRLQLLRPHRSGTPLRRVR